ETALKNNPVISAASGAMQVSRSRVGQARSNYYPQITASAGYSEYSLVTDPSNAHLNQYTGSVTVSQNIFDFGRTWNQVTVQQKNAVASGQDLRNTTAAIVLNVKQAYYALLQAEKNRDVLKETVKSFEQHLEQAQGFFDAGVKSKFDVTKAGVDLSNARLNLIRAENTLRIARVTLNNTMGLPDAPEYAIEDCLAFQKRTIAFEEARDRAYANRPDLQSVIARREAAEASVSLARSNYLPTLSGNASYMRSDEKYVPEPSGWSAGVTVTVPLFSGFLTSYQVKEAKENLLVLRANEETLKQGILLDVQQAYLNLQEAEERVTVAELTVKQAEENYEIARGRYDAGVGSPIEETDALVALSNARMSNIAALSDYKVAEAALVKAMGEQ
ncbi:MAG TPA: TolC family protein, partial [Nitrospirota bacterium]